MVVKSIPLVHKISQSRLHPFPRSENVVTKTLSITDSAVSAIPGPEGIWFYDRASTPTAFSPASLTKSLQSTLASYPFFAGRLEQIPFRKDGNWTERQGRLRVVYGRSDDPGIQVVVAAYDQELAIVIPNNNKRGRIWDSSGVPFDLFAGSDVYMALHDGVELGDAPLMKVQITAFSCGGLAIAAKIVHPLADAQTLTSFMHSWSVVHASLLTQRASNGSHGVPSAWGPILEPELFMALAAGDINGPLSDPCLVESARTLPMHRYDWWASADGCPAPLLWRTKVAPEVKDSGVDLPPLGDPIPWKDLDITEPISHYNILFSAVEVERIHAAASIPLSNGSERTFRLSHLDALLSHIWALIIRARNLPDEDEIFFNMVVNFRSRVSPPLSKFYAGTPAVLAYAKSTTKDAIGKSSLPRLATAIRSTISALNPSTIPHFLHDAAHQIEPKRYWQTFIGRHHVTATSWLHHGIHDIDFGSGLRPRYVEPVMPAYLVCVTEPGGNSPQVNGHAQEIGHKPWYSQGANVSIHFETRVMDRLLQDPELRAFDY